MAVIGYVLVKRVSAWGIELVGRFLGYGVPAYNMHIRVVADTGNGNIGEKPSASVSYMYLSDNDRDNLSVPSSPKPRATPVAQPESQ